MQNMTENSWDFLQKLLKIKIYKVICTSLKYVQLICKTKYYLSWKLYIGGVIRTIGVLFCSRPPAMFTISITGFFFRKTRLKGRKFYHFERFIIICNHALSKGRLWWIKVLRILTYEVFSLYETVHILKNKNDKFHFTQVKMKLNEIC